MGWMLRERMGETTVCCERDSFNTFQLHVHVLIYLLIIHIMVPTIYTYNTYKGKGEQIYIIISINSVRR